MDSTQEGEAASAVRQVQESVLADPTQDVEEWRDVVGYEDRYQVSNFGRFKVKERIITGWLGNNGYTGVYLPCGTKGYGGSPGKDRKGQKALLHKMVTEAFIGPCPKGMWVNHKDGNKRNNALSNLEYVTPSRNIEHAWEIGLRRRINPKPPADPELTHEQELEWVEHYAEGRKSMFDLVWSGNCTMKFVKKLLAKHGVAHVKFRRVK